MPVFLDRQDFLKVSAADLAKIYLLDSGILEEFGCMVLSCWFDQKGKTTFCLIEAPDLKSVIKMHCKVHNSPGQIFQVDEDLIETFLNYIDCSKSSAKNLTPQFHLSQKPIFCAVLVMNLYCSDQFFTKGYNRQKKLIENFKAFSQNLVKKNKGRILNTFLDGGIYSFDSISHCIKCALQIQKKLKLSLEFNKNGPKSILLRIGIDGGRQNEHFDVFDKIYVHAQRLCCIAGNNQIVISSLVKDEFPHEYYQSHLKTNNLKSLSYHDEQFLTRLMDIVDLNYQGDLKIGDFCKKMGKSRSQLYRKIIGITNLSPIALINEIRLKRVRELMDMKNGTNISQIAFEVGYNNLSYFSRRFKKRFGLRPSAYMNQSCSTCERS